MPPHPPHSAIFELPDAEARADVERYLGRGGDLYPQPVAELDDPVPGAVALRAVPEDRLGRGTTGPPQSSPGTFRLVDRRLDCAPGRPERLVHHSKSGVRSQPLLLSPERSDELPGGRFGTACSRRHRIYLGG